MSDEHLVNVAAGIAYGAHAGGVDKIGAPYINHVGRVASAVAAAGAGPLVESVAWLHDVIEDTDVALETLEAAGFGAEVLDAVHAITRQAGEDYLDFVTRAAQNPIARVVKRADVLDNLDPERLKRMEKDAQRRLRMKYSAALWVLHEADLAEAVDL